jgi:hypothetical protein
MPSDRWRSDAPELNWLHSSSMRPVWQKFPSDQNAQNCGGRQTRGILGKTDGTRKFGEQTLLKQCSKDFQYKLSRNTEETCQTCGRRPMGWLFEATIDRRFQGGKHDIQNHESCNQLWRSWRSINFYMRKEQSLADPFKWRHRTRQPLVSVPSPLALQNCGAIGEGQYLWWLQPKLLAIYEPHDLRLLWFHRSFLNAWKQIQRIETIFCFPWFDPWSRRKYFFKRRWNRHAFNLHIYLEWEMIPSCSWICSLWYFIKDCI